MKAQNNRPQCTSYGTLGLCTSALNLARYRRAYERKSTLSPILGAGCGWHHSIARDMPRSIWVARFGGAIKCFMNSGMESCRKVWNSIISVERRVALIQRILTQFLTLKMSEGEEDLVRKNLVQLIVNAVIRSMQRIRESGRVAHINAEYAAGWLRKADDVWHIPQVEPIQTELIVLEVILSLLKVLMSGKDAGIVGFVEFWPKRNLRCHNIEREC